MARNDTKMSECEDCIKLRAQIYKMREKIESVIDELDLHEQIWALRQLI